MAPAEKHRELIERLEREAAQSPAAYKAKVAALAAAGFLVLGAAVVLAFGLSVGLVLLLLAFSPWLLLKLAKLIWIPIAFGWMLLRSMWVKFSPPEGYRLAAGEAPALQAEVERLRAATDAPAIDGIVIDQNLNAAAVSVPRLFGFLGHKQYLLLGLPLMESLDSGQFASVIAHEFGHFGGGHDRFSGWIYHVRLSWYRLLAALRVRHSGANKPFVKFFDWYAPYFDAYSFVLARAQEYQADSAAARVAGHRTAGQALIRVSLGANRLEQHFWPGLQRASLTEPQPPALLFRDMAESLRRPHADDAEALSEAMARQPGTDDTHPTLSQRLQALGAAAEDVPPPQRSFAEEFLGDLLPVLQKQFSDEWREGVLGTWEDNHRQHAVDEARLVELDGVEGRDPGQRVEYADLVERLRPSVDVLELYREAEAHAPDNAFVQFRMGALLLHSDAGAAHLWRSIELGEAWANPSLQLLDSHYMQRGDEEGRKRVARAWADRQAADERELQARRVLTQRDQFEPHGIEENAIASLRAVLDRTGGVGRAWLARKRIPGKDMPHFVLLLKWRGLVTSESSKLRAIVDGFEVPGTLLAISISQRGIARAIKRAAGEPVYKKGWW